MTGFLPSGLVHSFAPIWMPPLYLCLVLLLLVSVSYGDGICGCGDEGGEILEYEDEKQPINATGDEDRQ